MAELREAIRALPAARALRDALHGGEDVWLVGGAVRDLLLGREPARDLDLVVESDARPVAERLAGALGGTATFHAPFLPPRARSPHHPYALATARRERYPRPGALPEVEPASLDEDLRRRDFTANAIAATLDGETRAPEGACEDLEDGRLRVFHDRSFTDDPTRVLRLVRYAARVDFAVDAATSVLARRAVAAGALDTVTGSRLGAELRLLLDEPAAGAGLGLADQLGVLAAVGAPLRFRPGRGAGARRPAGRARGAAAAAALQARAGGARPGAARRAHGAAGDRRPRRGL